MISEGKGLHAPARIRIQIHEAIVAELAAEATKRDEFRGYRNRNDVWGNGLISGSVLGKDGPQIKRSALPIFIGLGGEWAVIETLKTKVSGVKGLDVRLLDRGDGGKDLEIRGVRIDVKTRSKSIDGNRVKVFWPNGDRVKNMAAAYVFCEWVNAAFIDVLGWATLNDIGDWEREIGKGGHTNVISEDEGLKPLMGLVSLIESQL